ncbi:PLP-dependent aminotransferase family protein, partial [Phytoactinopolyspora endophytica]|uniref:aminotransferase-like domain-containing protein n=1 Tax=Phytoactinopolyspora endophytica TaxID=1642495 RepID=UPI00197C9D23
MANSDDSGKATAVNDLPLVLERDSDDPLALQVADQLRSAAARGLMRVGERLPSTRALAASLSVSRTVTAAAYEQLYAEGWLITRHGAGTFLAARPTVGTGDDPWPPAAWRTVEPDDWSTDDTATARKKVATTRKAVVPRHKATTDRAVHESVAREQVDLEPGSPWAAGIRTEMWRRAWRRAGDVVPDARPLRAGGLGYRAAVEEHLLRHRGLLAGSSAVLATNGTTSAVAELALAVFEPGDAIAVEEPGYPRAVNALRAAGRRVVPVPVDADGLMVEAIPAGVRAVYCTPAHQFPLGARLPA